MAAIDRRLDTGASTAGIARPAVACVLVAAGGLASAGVATMVADVPLRDPGAAATSRLAVATAIVLLFAAVDIVVRARRRRSGRRSTLSAMSDVRRERWTGRRAAIVLFALVAYTLAYLAYRNVKSVVPLLRPGEQFDPALLRIDHALGGGDAPAVVLQGVLGTGAAAQVLSGVYVLFFVFIPVAVAAGLAFPRDVRASLFVVTALATTWLLGAASYLLLPSIGPFHVEPAAYAALPSTAVTDMQHRLLAEREAFLADPAAPGSAQSIGAFASLHIAFCCAVALLAHRLRAPRPARAFAWVFLASTVIATVYFGWHYVVDDLAGVLIALVAVPLAELITGVSPRALRQSAHQAVHPEAVTA